MSSHASSRWLGIGVVIIALVAGGWFVTHRSIDQGPSPLKIGAIFPMTGGLAQYGDLASKSTILAIEEANRNGGVNGHPLVLNVQDHQCQAAKAVDAFKQLTSIEGIRYFLAAGCSGTAIAINPLLEKQIMVGSAISSPKVSGTSPRFFRNYGMDSAEGKLFATYVQQKNIQSVGVLQEETDYAKGIVLSFKDNLVSSTLPFTVESFTSDATDLRTQITKLRQLNPDVLLLSPQTVTTANIALKQMQELGYKPKKLIVNENVMKSEQLRTTFPALLNGATSADFKVQDSNALNAFLQAYKTRFGTDCAQTNICATSYDSARMLIEALRAGDDDANVAAYLKTISYAGVSGQIAFDAKNDRIEKGYRLFKIENGQPTMQE